MAWPSWMPLAARPSTWTDWSTVFREVIPREWPKGLFGPQSQAYKDLIAFGESLALVRDLLSFMQNAVIPILDENYVFLEDWEEAFDIKPKGTQSERMDRVIAMFRQRGTMTEDLVKAILCRAWGVDDPDEVGIVSPDPTTFAASGAVDAWQWAFLGHNKHIYNNKGNTGINRSLAVDLINQIKPTWEHWSVGDYRNLKWGTPGEEGAWDEAAWG